MNKARIQWKPGETVYYVVREGFVRGKGRYFVDDYEGLTWSLLAKDAIMFPFRSDALRYASRYGGRALKFKPKTNHVSRTG